MKKLFKGISKRVFALIISAFTVLSMIPLTTYNAFAVENAVCITVKNSSGENVAGAQITYYLNGDTTTPYNEVTTAEERTALQAANDAFVASAAVTVSSLKITADGYEEYSITSPIDVTDISEPILNAVMTEKSKSANLNFKNTVTKIYLKTAGNEYDFSASTDSTAKVIYSSSQPDVAKIDANGKVTAISVGTTQIKASVEADGIYLADEVTVDVTVEKDTIAPVVSKIDFSDIPDAADGKTVEVTATANDGETGIAKYAYSLDEGRSFTEINTRKFAVEPEYRDIVLVKAIDNAGNESALLNAEGKTVIVDNSSEAVLFEFYLTTGAQEYKQDNELYTNDTIKVEFKITDEKLDTTAGNPIIRVNKKAVSDIAWNGTSGEGTFDISAEGRSVYSLEYTDTTGKINHVNSETTVIIDKTAPTVNEVLGNPTNWVADEATLTVEAEDGLSPKLQYSINGGANWSDINKFTVTENKEYSIIVKDAVGNISSEEKVTVKNIDASAPEIVDLKANITDWTSENVTISGKVSDVGSGIKELKYKKTGDSDWSTYTFDDDGNFTLDVDKSGEITYTFYGIDNVGKESSEKSVIVKIDKEAPKVSAENISGWKNKNFKIKGTVEETLSGISKVQYRLKGHEDWNDAVLTGETYDFETNLDTSDKSDKYFYEIQAIDNTNNISTIITTDEILFDNQKPTSETAPKFDNWVNKEFTVIGKFNDDYSEIAKVLYGVKDEDGVEEAVLETDGNYKIKLPATDDNKEYFVYAKDNAGNESDKVTFNAKIDVTKPDTPTISFAEKAIVELLHNISFGIFKTEQTVTFSSTDNLSGIAAFKYTLGNVTETVTAENNSGSTTIPFDTNAALSVIAIDNAGNKSEVTKSKDTYNQEFTNVIVDENDPEIKTAEVLAVDWENHKTTIRVTASDDNAGIKAVYYYRKGDEQNKKTLSLDNGVYTATIDEKDYNVEYEVFCVDYADRESAKTPIVIKEDTEAPELENPVAEPNYATNEVVVISGTVTDTLSGVNEVLYKIGENGVLGNADFNETTGEYNFKISNAEDFSGPVYVWAIDKAGKSSENDSKSVNVTIDIKAPELGEYAVSPEKIIDGAYAANVQLVISGGVKDSIAGVKNVYYKIGEGEKQTAALVNTLENNSYNITIPAENFHGNISVWAEDKANSDSEEGNVSKEKLIPVMIDMDAPVFGADIKVDPNKATSGNVKITGSITDNISGVSKIYYKLGENGTTVEKGITITNNTKTSRVTEGTYEIDISACSYEGEVYIWAKDALGNTTEQKALTSVYMDKEAPEITDLKANPDVATNGDVVITAKVKDLIAKYDAISVKYTDTDGEEKDATLTEAGELEFTLTPIADNTAFYDKEITVTATDEAGNKSEKRVKVFIDKIEPVINDDDIKYSTPVSEWYEGILEKITFGAYRPEEAPLIVTVTASDDTSGIDYIQWKYTKQEGASESNDFSQDDYVTILAQNVTTNEEGKTVAEFEVPEKSRGYVSVRAFDKAGNSVEEHENDRINIVDTVSPEVSVEYTSGDFKEGVKADGTEITRENQETYDNTTRFVYAGEVTATITVTEANFYDDMKIVVTKDGKPAEKEDYTVSDAWTKVKDSGDIYQKEIVLKAEGDYQIKLNYNDRSQNNVNYQSTVDDKTQVQKVEKQVEYVSNIHTVDKTQPNCIVEYESTPHQTKENRDYFKEPQTLTITVEDRNFRPSDVVLEVTTKNPNSKTDETPFVAPDLTVWDSWERDAANPHMWKAEVECAEDGNYDLSFKATDIADNESEVASKSYSIDKTNPKIDDIKYSTPVSEWYEEILEVITFGAYRPEEAPLIVTVTASDDTSGIDYIQWKYTKQDDTSNSNEESMAEYVSATMLEDGNSAEFEVPEKSRGYVSVMAFDNAGNSVEEHENNRINIVDTVSPEVSVAYNGEVKQYVDSNLVTVDSWDHATRAYYDKNVTATITVTEANFYEGTKVITQKADPEQGTDAVYETVHDFGIKVTKTDNNGAVTVTEYLPEGAADFYKEGVTDKKIIKWTQDVVKKDNYSVSIDFEEDADYVLELSYNDKSKNEAMINADDNPAQKSYKSKILTVDKTQPDVSVKYDKNSEVVHTIDGRDYFGADRQATITVEEHNFRADDFKATVIAKDVDGKSIQTEDFAAKLADDSNWDHEGNTHTIKLDYVVDANYDFGYEYFDLAAIKAEDYAGDKFTVDKVAPGNLKVSYSTTVFQNILSHITFGYYNAQMTVTVSAEDDVAGVHRFEYSYINKDGVSKVNAELINQAINEAAIVREGYTSTASFKIPKNLPLNKKNQFNGTVEFTAFDRAENKSVTLKDTEVLVVDNIKPVSSIKFTQPVKTVNNISYYNGDIGATVVINEANFYKQDVKVTVTRDGRNYPVRVNWVDNSVDVHTGTFTLSGDGDYIVNVTYADRSTNEMKPIVSNQLTIDTKDPVITVSDIKHQSANNKETISVSVSVTDKNIALNDFKPVLRVVYKEASGKNSYTFKTMTVPLGNPRTTVNANGETVYQYTVANLKTDGYYSLECVAIDHANHSVSAISASANGGGAANVNTVNFSVNRDGSVFWIETEHNDKYSGKTYKNELDGAYANDSVKVELHEVNVDRVNERQEPEFTLNDGSEAKDIVLTEKTGNSGNYEKNTRVGTGGWYENVYTLDNSQFDHDGVYSLNIVTYDNADNTNVNTKKNEDGNKGTIRFTLDRTKPVITSNVSNGERIGENQFNVEFKVNDINFDPETVKVKIMKGKEEIDPEIKVLDNNSYQFLLRAGTKYSMEITAMDIAGNTSELYKIDDLAISDNPLVLFFADGSNIILTVCIGVALIGGIIFLVLYKRKKKIEE